MRRGFIGFLVSMIAAASMMTTLASSAGAVTGSQFQPGNIISDQLFYNPNTMGTAQVQDFLNSVYTGCASGYVCMRDYTVTTPNEAPSAGLCNGYSGAQNESAAQVLVKVAVSCGVNPQVLLVLIQKESGLLTSRTPSYTQVTGYGCPDATGCNANYYGYFNQVYLAAQQFKRYRLNPNNYGYVAGRSNYILYNPNTACGGSQVYIQNQATAGLYDYTPYQPNAAALNNLSGVGDSCSAYGNRNFWVYFNNWFGPTNFMPPVGGSATSCLGSTTGGATASTLLTGSVPVGTPSVSRRSDLVAIDAGGGTWYYQNNGSSTPFVNRSSATGSSLLFFNETAIGDVNGDGRADLIATAPDGSLWYFLGNGTSTPFSAGAVQIGSTGWAAFNWIGLGDVSGDGRDDLLATTPDGRLFFYQNNGTSSPFSGVPTVLGSGWQAYSTVAVGDVNGDGRADLVATTASGALVEFLNNGTATPFSSPTTISSAGWNNFNRIDLADIEGSGRADLVATSPDGRLWEYQNNATATPFAAYQIIGSGGWQNYPTIMLADVHGSGLADLVARRPDGSLWYYQNNGTTTPYVGLANVGSGGWNNFTTLTSGDVTGDGLQDIVATSSDGRLWYYPNTGTCSPYSRSFVIGSGGWQNFTNVVLADVNGDGKADIVATDYAGRLWYFQNNGTGTPYLNGTIIGSGGWQNFTNVVLADVNGDGKADVVATDYAGRLWYFQNNGTSTPYVAGTVIGSGGWQNFTHIVLADVNGDGKADVLAVDSVGRLWYYQNNGTATPFTNGTVIGTSGWTVYNSLIS